jgi:DNA-binding transcriptional MerR regulator
MEYTVHELAELAGITARTIRYYDEIGLLKPARINSSGYRIYRGAEVDRLQQIMFYRELGVSLNDIKNIMNSPLFNRVEALKEHRARLIDEKKRLEVLIANVEKTIAMLEGRIIMTDREKFEGFKQKMIEENELEYGKEAREKYGDKAVDASNRKLMNMTEEEYAALMKLTNELNETLKAAYETAIPEANWLRKRVICTGSGLCSSGAAIPKRPTWDLHRCMWTMRGLRHTTIRLFRDVPSFCVMQ